MTWTQSSNSKNFSLEWKALHEHLKSIKYSILKATQNAAKNTENPSRVKTQANQREIASVEHLKLQLKKLEQLHKGISDKLLEEKGTTKEAVNAWEKVIEETLKAAEILTAKLNSGLVELELDDVEHVILRAWRMELIEKEWSLRINREQVQQQSRRIKEVETKLIEFLRQTTKRLLGIDIGSCKSKSDSEHELALALQALQEKIACGSDTENALGSNPYSWQSLIDQLLNTATAIDIESGELPSLTPISRKNEDTITPKRSPAFLKICQRYEKCKSDLSQDDEKESINVDNFLSEDREVQTDDLLYRDYTTTKDLKQNIFELLNGFIPNGSRRRAMSAPSTSPFRFRYETLESLSSSRSSQTMNEMFYDLGYEKNDDGDTKNDEEVLHYPITAGKNYLKDYNTISYRSRGYPKRNLDDIESTHLSCTDDLNTENRLLCYKKNSNNKQNNEESYYYYSTHPPSSNTRLHRGRLNCIYVMHAQNGIYEIHQKTKLFHNKENEFKINKEDHPSLENEKNKKSKDDHEVITTIGNKAENEKMEENDFIAHDRWRGDIEEEDLEKNVEDDVDEKREDTNSDIEEKETNNGIGYSYGVKRKEKQEQQQYKQQEKQKQQQYEHKEKQQEENINDDSIKKTEQFAIKTEENEIEYNDDDDLDYDLLKTSKVSVYDLVHDSKETRKQLVEVLKALKVTLSEFQKQREVIMNSNSSQQHIDILKNDPRIIDKENKHCPCCITKFPKGSLAGNKKYRGRKYNKNINYDYNSHRTTVLPSVSTTQNS